MNRFLTQQEVAASLTAGKTVEVFLGRDGEDVEVISWLDFQKTKDGLIFFTAGNGY